jgi:hypothetical protein
MGGEVLEKELSTGQVISKSPWQAWLENSETFQGRAGRDAPLSKPGLQHFSKRRVVLQQSINEIIVLLKGNELKGRDAVHGDNDGLVMAQSPVLAQPGLCLTQRDQFHGVR